METTKRQLPTLKRYENEKCMVVLTLDTRHTPSMKEMQKMQEQGKSVESICYPAVIRVTSFRKRVFLPTGCKFTESDFIVLCNAYKEREEVGYSNGSKAFYKDCCKLIDQFGRATSLIKELSESGNFSLEAIDEKFTGKTDNKKNNLNIVWQEVIDEKKADGKVKTALSYEQALRRFTADMGDKVNFARISNAFIQDWRKKMLAKGINVTSAGIYLRTMRAVVNVCIERELIKGNTKDLFKNAKLSNTDQRTGEFLNADMMQRLYDFWLADEAKDADGKELFATREKRALFRNLGLFLFSYLANGANVADILNLRYNEHYQNTNGTEFLFFRHKTSARTGKRSIVIVPTDLQPMQVLLERLANKPTAGGLVFGILNGTESNEQETEKIHKCNANIRKYLAKVAPLVGLDVMPTAAWARHSFATNLSNEGVPIKYIDSSMGHADGKDVINFYLGGYPHDKRVEYNSKLLPMMQGGKREKLLAAGFTEEQIKVIMSI